MTEEEAAKAKQQEIMDKLAALQKDNSRMKQEKLLIAAGYDPETALKLAGYIVDGDAEAFVKAQTAWLAEQRKAIYAQTKEELLKSTPALNMGGGKDETPPDVAFAKARAKERAAQTEAANKARQIYFK